MEFGGFKRLFFDVLIYEDMVVVLAEKTIKEILQWRTNDYVGCLYISSVPTINARGENRDSHALYKR